MAVPTITSLTPNTGPTGGRTLVDLAGTNFRLPTTPPLTGSPSGPLKPSVEVLVGGKLSEQVDVVSAARLLFLTPITPAKGPGSEDVIVRNIDDNGDPIAGETVTLTNGFTYFLPSLTVESELTRLVRTLLRDLKRQVLPNTVITTNTDFDPVTGDLTNLIEVATLPALILSGPATSENRFFSLNDRQELVSSTDPEEVLIRRRPYTIDLEWTLFGVTGGAGSTVTLLNLARLVIGFFQRNKFLVMDKDATDPTKGTVRYEMDFTIDGEPDVVSQPNESNIRQFSAAFVIRGFDLEDLAGVANDLVALTHKTLNSDTFLEVDTEATGDSFAIGPSPGDC